MSMTGLEVFDTTLQKTHRWLNDLMQIMDWDDKHLAYLGLRTTLHALRDRLIVDEVAHLGAQLPMLIRGFYYEGWDPSDKPLNLRHKDEFLAAIERPFRDEIPFDTERVARAVFTVIARRISEGEIEDIQHVLPAHIRELWP